MNFPYTDERNRMRKLLFEFDGDTMFPLNDKLPKIDPDKYRKVYKKITLILAMYGAKIDQYTKILKRYTNINALQTVIQTAQMTVSVESAIDSILRENLAALDSLIDDMDIEYLEYMNDYLTNNRLCESILQAEPFAKMTDEINGIVNKMNRDDLD